MTCPKQGSEMEAVVLCRVGFLAYSCPKQGQECSAAPLYPNMGQVPPPGSLTFCLQKRKGQHKFDATKRWVTRNFTASGGRVTILNKKYKRRARRFYIHAHRDSSGPTPPPSKKWMLPYQCLGGSISGLDVLPPFLLVVRVPAVDAQD